MPRPANDGEDFAKRTRIALPPRTRDRSHMTADRGDALALLPSWRRYRQLQQTSSGFSFDWYPSGRQGRLELAAGIGIRAISRFFVHVAVSLTTNNDTVDQHEPQVQGSQGRLRADATTGALQHKDGEMGIPGLLESRSQIRTARYTIGAAPNQQRDNAMRLSDHMPAGPALPAHTAFRPS
jgi:hypothetical protein